MAVRFVTSIKGRDLNARHVLPSIGRCEHCVEYDDGIRLAVGFGEPLHVCARCLYQLRRIWRMAAGTCWHCGQSVEAARGFEVGTRSHVICGDCRERVMAYLEDRAECKKGGRIPAVTTARAPAAPTYSVEQFTYSNTR